MLKPVLNRSTYYGRAFKWCVVVVALLMLPYLFSTYIDYITVTIQESKDGFIGSFIRRIKLDINNGKFLFIPIGLASASYIDFIFQKGLIAKEALIHVCFFTLLIIILGMFTCIDLMNAIDKEEMFNLEHDNVHSIITIHLGASFMYSWGVKSLIFNYRANNYIPKK